MNNRQEASMARDNGLCTFLVDNTHEYEGDTAFEDIVAKTIADYALTMQAAADATANNTGYSLNKLIARDEASVFVRPYTMHYGTLFITVLPVSNTTQLLTGFENPTLETFFKAYFKDDKIKEEVTVKVL